MSVFPAQHDIFSTTTVTRWWRTVQPPSDVLLRVLRVLRVHSGDGCSATVSNGGGVLNVSATCGSLSAWLAIYDDGVGVAVVRRGDRIAVCTSSLSDGERCECVRGDCGEDAELALALLSDILGSYGVTA